MLIPPGPGLGLGGPVYSDHDTFLKIHNEGVQREMAEETAKAQRFSDVCKSLCAILLHRSGPDDEMANLVIAVDFRSHVDVAPLIGERCRVSLAVFDQDKSHLESVFETAIRVREPTLTSPEWKSYVTFSISPKAPEWNSQPWRDVLGEPLGAEKRATGPPPQHQLFMVSLSLNPSLITFEAEQATLRKAEQLWKSNHPARFVLDTLVLLKKPRMIVDLANSIYSHLPLNQNWESLIDANPPTKAQLVLRDFNDDQKRALKLMRSLPDGLAFVPGCPGSGKTHWALSSVALAQSGSHKAQTLYLLDINHTADDAADRMVQTYQQWGFKRRVIRMHGWSKVTQKTKKFAQDALPDVLPNEPDTEEAESSNPDICSLEGDVSEESEEDLKADFRRTFAQEAVKRKVLCRTRDQTKAPTLDEAAWEHYQEHAHKFPEVTHQLAEFLVPDQDGGKKKELDAAIVLPLRRMYKDVLLHADFIATTPFAAQAYLQFLKPDLVVFDEAGHAREVSTLMSVVYFQPKAWLFVGDYRQIRPYVSRQEPGEDPHPLLFCISAMERLALNKLTHAGLLKNHRSHANLQQLPSALFYGGGMTAEIMPVPQPVRLLRKFLDEKRGRPSGVPRLVVDLPGEMPQAKGKSWWHPHNTAWVAECVAQLLEGRLPRGLDGTGEGTILIVSPYKAAVEAYESMVEDRFPEQENISVRTLNTAQGLEADFVVVDLVRGSSFVHDSRRLCVALTRARQAEVVMMSMKSMRGFGLLRNIWDLSRVANQTLTTKSPLVTTDGGDTEGLRASSPRALVW